VQRADRRPIQPRCGVIKSGKARTRLGISKNMADHMQFAASNVKGGIVPNSGHWIMEENPQAIIKLVTEFLAK
jgi:pimeloyl-ACP methyl ester carboxylesterase